MDGTNSDKFSIGKLVFLGIFLAAVLAAWMVSTSRTTLKMEPVAAVCDELTVSMPTGKQWENPSKGEWVYQQNMFIQQRVHGAHRDCIAEVRYQLGPITEEPSEYLVAARHTWGMGLVSQGLTDAEGVKLTWGGYANRDGETLSYYAVGALGEGRAVTILVWGRPGTSLLVESVFHSIVKSVRFIDTGLLAKGTELVRLVCENGLDRLGAQLPSDALLVKDDAGKAVGFYVIKTSVMTQPREALMEGMYYGGDSNPQLTRTRFRTPDLASFVWRTWDAANPSAEAVVKVENSSMVAARRGYSRQVEADLSEAAMAKAAIELAGWELLQRAMPEAVVDSVAHDGSIVPTRITPGGSPSEGEKWSYCAVLTSMVSPESYSEVFYGRDGAVVGWVEHMNGTHTYEQATVEQVMRIFPDLAALVTQFEKGTIDAEPLDKEIDYGTGPI